jgi:hypothetical protein
MNGCVTSYRDVHPVWTAVTLKSRRVSLTTSMYFAQSPRLELLPVVSPMHICRFEQTVCCIPDVLCASFHVVVPTSSLLIKTTTFGHHALAASSKHGS